MWRTIYVNFIVDEGAELPKYTDLNSGSDLRALGILHIYKEDGKRVDSSTVKKLNQRFKEEGTFTMLPRSRAIFDSGLTIADFNSNTPVEAQVRPRSGISIKTPLQVILGTIDQSYRGKIGIIVVNNSNTEFTVNLKDRIAQLVFAPILIPMVRQTDTISETERGANGFGSSGVK